MAGNISERNKNIKVGIILDSQNNNQFSDLKKTNKTLVLVGGCFDILHAGHIEFLKRAKELGDILIVLLESDSKIKKLKGEKRPVNSQEDRSLILSNLPFVSYVYPLPDLKSNENYKILVKRLKPDIIAISGTDFVFDWEKKLEKEGFLKIVKVMDRIPNKSTTKLAENL